MQTGLEIYQGVLQELNKANTESMTPEEFNYHAKVGTLEWTKMRFWAFDKHQKTIDDLQPIIIISGSIAPITTIQGIEEWVIPTDLLYLLRVDYNLEYLGDTYCTDGKTIECEAVRYRGHNLGNNAYDRPSNENHYYLESEGQIKRVGKGLTTIATSAIIHYLRYPAFPEVSTIDGTSVTSSDFGTMQNIEIVKWITASYLEKIESLRSQSMLGIQSGVFTHQANI